MNLILAGKEGREQRIPVPPPMLRTKLLMPETWLNLLRGTPT